MHGLVQIATSLDQLLGHLHDRYQRGTGHASLQTESLNAGKERQLPHGVNLIGPFKQFVSAHVIFTVL
jgi:hypothetical protein